MSVITNTAKKFKNLANSIGPNLSSFPFRELKRTEEFDYEITKMIYNLFNKEKKKIILESSNNEKSDADSFYYEGILQMMQSQDNDPYTYGPYLIREKKDSENTNFNLFLKEFCHSFEQIVHQSHLADKFLPKTKDGKITYLYRVLMRSLIKNKERNLKLIDTSETRLVSNSFASDLEEFRKEFKDQAKIQARSYIPQEEFERFENLKEKIEKSKNENSAKTFRLISNKPV